MTQSIRRETPLAQFNADARDAGRPGDVGVRMTQRPFLGHLNLRGNQGEEGNPSFLTAVETVLGFGLPLEPNTVAEGSGLAALWLGPDEWLVLTPAGQETGVAQSLRDALDGQHVAVTDVSGGQTVINIAGEHARDVLAKGCSLDLHPRVFGPGRCAQSLVAKAGVTLRQNDVSPSFDLIVRRSFAEYLALWLEDAAQEYGLAVSTEDQA